MRFSQYVNSFRNETATFTGTEVRSFSDLRERGLTNPRAAIQGARGYQQDLREAERIIARVMSGDRWAGKIFREAMTTSDFPFLFGDVIDRSVLANYAETPYTWAKYIKRAAISDFRQAKIFRVDRGAAVLDQVLNPTTLLDPNGSGSTGLAQVAEYPMRRRVDSQYTDQVYKFGARMDFAWETMIDDDLDALKDTPALFGRAARRTEEKRATALYVSSTGPNATFFSNGNLNLVNSTVNSVVTTNNPPLSVTALMWALIIMASQTDSDGEPIDISAVTLVVPPALKYTAMNIIRTSQIAMNDMGGTVSSGNASLQRLYAPNPFEGIVDVAVNYYAPIVNTSAAKNTAWYIFSSPNNGRPAAQLSFLRGHETPEMFMKSPNQVAIGEGRMGPGAGSMPGTGLTNPMEGDFDTDGIAYKIRHCLGGTLLDPKMAVASTGAGS